MAKTIDPIVVAHKSAGEQDVLIITWSNVQNGDTCKPFSQPGWADRNAQVLGTAGTGLHVKFDGSNAGSLADPEKGVKAVEPAANEYNSMTLDGTAIDLTATPGWTGFDICPMWMRPNVTGDVNTAVDIRMLARRT